MGTEREMSMGDCWAKLGEMEASIGDEKVGEIMGVQGADDEKVDVWLPLILLIK